MFGTPTINDGETMGTDGMRFLTILSLTISANPLLCLRYSLVSRDLIADCVETMYEGYSCDAVITVGGCDKTQVIVDPLCQHTERVTPTL